MRDACVVSVPARTSISLLDSNTFAPGVPGGGNVGFAINARTQLTVTRASKNAISVSCLHRQSQRSAVLLIRHVLSVWKTVDSKSAYRIEVNNWLPQHMGLASSAALQSATFMALNWLAGIPKSEKQLRTLAAKSYREVVHGNLQQGFTTTLSTVLNFYGGFAIVTTHGNINIRLSSPKWNFVVGTLNVKSRSFGAMEARVLMGRARDFDKQESREKQSIVFTELVPAVAAADLERAGAAIHHIQTLGSKRAEIGIYGSSAHIALKMLRQHGIECAFLSAVGPGIVLLSNRSLAKLRHALGAAGLVECISGELDNVGLMVRTI